MIRPFTQAEISAATDAAIADLSARLAAATERAEKAAEENSELVDENATLEIRAHAAESRVAALEGAARDAAAYADAPKTHEMDDGEAGVVCAWDVLDTLRRILNDKAALTAPAPQVSLDERMKAAGMIPLSDILAGKTPLEAFRAHIGVCDAATFGQWLAMRYRSMMTMRVQYELGDQDKDDGLYEWVFAHSAAFGEAMANWRKAYPQAATVNDPLTVQSAATCNDPLQVGPVKESLTTADQQKVAAALKWSAENKPGHGFHDVPGVGLVHFNDGSDPSPETLARWERDEAMSQAAADVQTSHTTQEDYEHFLSYTGIKDTPEVRLAYHHGANSNGADGLLSSVGHKTTVSQDAADQAYAEAVARLDRAEREG